MSTELRLGTRGSQLTLWQANTVAARIADAGGPPCRIVVIKTDGDRLQERPLSEIGSKDMSAVLPAGLTIGGVLPRENPLDALVLPVRLEADTTDIPGSSGSRDV